MRSRDHLDQEWQTRERPNPVEANDPFGSDNQSPPVENVTEAVHPRLKHRNLIVVRAGDQSLHPTWLKKRNVSNFDVFVSYYGDSIGRYSNEAQYYEAAKGLKWPVLAKLVSERADLFAAYDACWFPDDDLLADANTVNLMFDLFHEHNLSLAQPALANGSHVTYPATIQAAQTKLRFVGFVEIMCPIFSRSTLMSLHSTFSASASGWGLDFLWSHLLDYPQDRIAILDETPIIHTRPLHSGPYYAQCAKLGVDPGAELVRILSEHGIEWNRDIPIYKSVK